MPLTDTSSAGRPPLVAPDSLHGCRAGGAAGAVGAAGPGIVGRPLRGGACRPTTASRPKHILCKRFIAANINGKLLLLGRTKE